jgi:hypothetical protein
MQQLIKGCLEWSLLAALLAAIYSIIRIGMDCAAIDNRSPLLWQFLLSGVATLIGTSIFILLNPIRDGGWGWGYIGGFILYTRWAMMMFFVSLCFFGVLLGPKKRWHAIALAASLFLPVTAAVIKPVHSRLLEGEWEIWDNALRYGAQGYDAEYYARYLSRETSYKVANLLADMDNRKNAEFRNIPSDTLDILYQLNFDIGGCPTLTGDLARKIYKHQYPRWQFRYVDRESGKSRFLSNENLPPDIQDALIAKGDIFYLTRNKSLTSDNMIKICNIIFSKGVAREDIGGTTPRWEIPSGWTDTANNLFRNPNTPAEYLSKLYYSNLYHPNGMMRYGLARNPNCPDDIKCEIISNADYNFFESIIAHLAQGGQNLSLQVSEAVLARLDRFMEKNSRDAGWPLMRAPAFVDKIPREHRPEYLKLCNEILRNEIRLPVLSQSSQLMKSMSDIIQKLET